MYHHAYIYQGRILPQSSTPLIFYLLEHRILLNFTSWYPFNTRIIYFKFFFSKLATLFTRFNQRKMSIMALSESSFVYNLSLFTLASSRFFGQWQKSATFCTKISFFFFYCLLKLLFISFHVKILYCVVNSSISHLGSFWLYPLFY